jgi:ABC-type Na+ efflux pump permease subunit
MCSVSHPASMAVGCHSGQGASIVGIVVVVVVVLVVVVLVVVVVVLLVPRWLVWPLWVGRLRAPAQRWR